MNEYVDKSVKIDPTAIIDRGAKIGKNCKIWQWVHICEGAKIGSNCIFGQNVFVASNVSIGNNVKIQNNVSIYDNVILEDDVFCGPSMVFTNVSNPRSAYPKKHEYQTTLIKKGATLGANCTIVCGITIGKNAFIGAGSVITKNVKDYALYIGVPGKHVGWMSSYGEKINLPLKGEGSWFCEKSNTLYTLNQTDLIANKTS